MNAEDSQKLAYVKIQDSKDIGESDVVEHLTQMDLLSEDGECIIPTKFYVTINYPGPYSSTHPAGYNLHPTVTTEALDGHVLLSVEDALIL